MLLPAGAGQTRDVLPRVRRQPEKRPNRVPNAREDAWRGGYGCVSEEVGDVRAGVEVSLTAAPSRLALHAEGRVNLSQGDLFGVTWSAFWRYCVASSLRPSACWASDIWRYAPAWFLSNSIAVANDSAARLLSRWS